MVAKITMPATILAALNYNENKVNEDKAECLHAEGYLREHMDMSFYQKLEGFERRNRLNDRAASKTMHVSLNFSPSEKLSNSKLVEIARDYMNKIGFGDQPFIVYKHKDAGHPHIHIVTTTIKQNGKRIDTHNIGRNQSEKARKEIEKNYNLIRAEDQGKLRSGRIQPVNIEKALYGRSETKQSISNIVTAVMEKYLFASLPEFNAILKGFNVVADRGQEDGRIYKNRGLVFRILDGDGNKIGVPVKASAIYSKPTLANLEKHFEKNKVAKEQFKQPLKKTLDEVLLQYPKNITELTDLLQRKNVTTVLRQNTEGRIYGITFVDHNNKAVFNGSDLGKAYSAAHILEKLKPFEKLPAKEADQSQGAQFRESSATEISLLDVVIAPREEFNYTPGALLKKKRKKKRRSLGL